MQYLSLKSITEDIQRGWWKGTTAQYYSGLRYLSSMKRYYKDDVQKLKKKLAVLHPLEGL